jgi:hypothetical protein
MYGYSIYNLIFISKLKFVMFYFLNIIDFYYLLILYEYYYFPEPSLKNKIFLRRFRVNYYIMLCSCKVESKIHV